MHDHEAEAREWDELYVRDGEGAPIWSGRPNGALVAEAADLAPGRVLDVGCGEGADAVWLAQRGWAVTALDPSRVALDRAEAAARQAEVQIRWFRGGLLEVADGTATYDLVSVQYPGIRLSEAAIGTLLSAVAPGGTLLFVHHDLDRSDFVMPDDVAAALDQDWVVEVRETRPRPGPLPPEAQHVRDIVLRARRLTTT